MQRSAERHQRAGRLSKRQAGKDRPLARVREEREQRFAEQIHPVARTHGIQVRTAATSKRRWR